MDQYLPHLEWIYSTEDDLSETLFKWSAIHSGSYNFPGLASMMDHLIKAFTPLGGEIKTLSLPSQKKHLLNGMTIEQPLGQALKITKYPDHDIQILLGGHMDIALPENQPLAPPQKSNEGSLIGRGVADMKGGLLVLLTALKALEKSPFAGKLGWQVLIVPDEEIGSPGSRSLWQEISRKKRLALLFEPSLPDGSLVNARKGSMNFTLNVKGKAAHVGREFETGQNAITSCCRFALAADKLTDLSKGTTLNIGSIRGGGAVNIIPDRADLRLNVRCGTKEELKRLKESLHELVKEENCKENLHIRLFQDSERPPKLFDKKTQILFEALKGSAKHLGIDLKWKTSGGACDGNLIADHGTPTIDTLGVVGGNLHTEEEYAILSSLTKRAALTARFLMQIAAGEI